MNSIIEEIKHNFKSGNIITKLIFVNVGVALIIILGNIITPLVIGKSVAFNFGDFMVNLFAVRTNDLSHFITHPYAIFTHMFIHNPEDITHVLFNMLYIYFFGKLFLNYFNSKQLFGLFVLGGLIGVSVLLAIAALSPAFNNTSGPAYGASAAAMAIVVAIGTYTPNTETRLFGVIKIQLKWIVVALVAIDLLKFHDANVGGHIGHLAGAATGFWFTTSIKTGKDITKGINNIINRLASIFKRKPKLKVEFTADNVRKMTDEQYNAYRKLNQEYIDEILDKISKSGYGSLTKQEKEDLFKFSNKK